ncbi:MAG: HAD-IIB family hydrolase [Gammaproteobacteria bacterium]|nr:HAD-IIB family hydrolase [Gammaproteobacteria bacterium]
MLLAIDKFPFWEDIRGICSDIDDTLTENAIISANTKSHLEALVRHGIKMIAVTGRSLAWSQKLIEECPVFLAIVAENGGVAITPTVGGSWEVSYFTEDEVQRKKNTQVLKEVLLQIQQSIPNAKPSLDNSGRVTDLAIDHHETHYLPPNDIIQVVDIMRQNGLQVTVSSIHINGWFGDYNKWLGTRWLFKKLYNRDLSAELNHWLYVGDSKNDEMMFEHFIHTFGVANIKDYLSELDHPPRYITRGHQGRGFVEIAQKILSHSKKS